MASLDDRDIQTEDTGQSDNSVQTNVPLFYPGTGLISTGQFTGVVNYSSGFSSVLDQLQACLAENVQLQEELEQYIETVSHFLEKNKKLQKEAETLSQSHTKYTRSSIQYFIRQKESKIPYFVDMKREAPPPNSDTVSRQGLPTEVYINSFSWIKKDDIKLKAGVQQKNLELLTLPLQERMMSEDVTVEQLKELQGEISSLRQQKGGDLLKYSKEIVWDRLAYEQFDLRHTGLDCHMRYKNYLQPGINHKSWKSAEIVKLNKIAKAHSYRDWEDIAKELATNRTGIQCLQVYQTSQFAKREWSNEEDVKLNEAILLYGNNWTQVSQHVGTRTKQQCLIRHNSAVKRPNSGVSDSPVCNVGRWKNEEHLRLEKAIEQFGTSGFVWPRIAQQVGTRNATQCRERYRNTMSGDHLVRPWTEVESKLLNDYCKSELNNGKAIQWAKISKELNRRDDAVRRHWVAKSSPEDLLLLKTVSLKNRETKYMELHKINIDPNNMGCEQSCNIMSEPALAELEAYKQKLLAPSIETKLVIDEEENEDAQPSNSRKRKRRKRRKNKDDNSEETTSSQTTTLAQTTTSNISLTMPAQTTLAQSTLAQSTEGQTIPPVIAPIQAPLIPYSLIPVAAQPPNITSSTGEPPPTTHSFIMYPFYDSSSMSAQQQQQSLINNNRPFLSFDTDPSDNDDNLQQHYSFTSPSSRPISTALAQARHILSTPPYATPGVRHDHTYSESVPSTTSAVSKRTRDRRKAAKTATTKRATNSNSKESCTAATKRTATKTMRATSKKTTDSVKANKTTTSKSRKVTASTSSTITNNEGSTNGIADTQDPQTSTTACISKRGRRKKTTPIKNSNATILTRMTLRSSNKTT